ncbi:MAG TPA: amino acid adenylation domain-containing protein [Candidatus Sulfotelmatobacter sp.]|nr:amino acid adenylation domain-containing protein [Candidatus Sulfotelmatobacter sp.]
MYVHELIAAQAKKAPEAVAVFAGDLTLTYRELDARANEVASHLRSQGVGPDVIVALCMQRSAAPIVAALGILKAGAAYLPLDPADPAGRLAMLLEDSAAPLLLTQEKVARLLPSGNAKIITLGQDGTLPSRHTEVAPAKVVSSSDLAYVIYTSGSTGRPKGVEIAHANLLNLIQWHIRAFQITSSDQATLQASPGFDAAVWELWPYLAAGATVHIVDEAVRTTPELLRDWMGERGITISFVPTALAEALIALRWPQETSLRFLLTGADVLRSYPRQGLPFVLVNNYGPTECSVVSTSGEVSADGQTDQLPTIGRPIDGVQVYIVDEQMNQVPEGACGELAIGGAGVGRGYLNRPELTAEKFLPDPFAGKQGARLYRTGDLARAGADGQIIFLGRIDEQVKIRGYRIEPGEVSAVLNRHAGIDTSFVTTQAEPSGPRLIAYIVVKAGACIQAGTLRSFLADRLPDYMVPSTFVKIARLPLTSHGKVDRSALPAPAPDNVLSEEVYDPPQSEIEQWLADLLTSLLGVKRISRDDNFFRLGGHSLLGAQLIAKIQQRFGVELSLRNLFDHPSVKGIAAEIENLIRTQVESLTEDEAQRVLESLSGGISV